MTKRHRLERLLRVYSDLFFGFGFFVLAAEKVVFRFMDLFRRLMPVGPELSPASDTYWRFLVVSLLWTLAIMCRWARADIDQGRNLIRLVIYSKLISGITMSAHFFLHAAPAVYLFGGNLDFCLGVLLIIYYARAFPGGLRDILIPSPGPVL